MSLRIVNNSDVNKVSNTLTSYLKDRKLKSDEEAVYRLLNGTLNVDPQKKDGVMLYPSVQGISLNDTIIDPENQTVVRIGLPKTADRDGNVVFRKFYVTPKKNEGTFSLRGNVAADIEIYNVLELLSLNKSNPYRNEDVEPLFERVDGAAESKARSEKTNYLRLALNAIDGWDYDHLRVIGSSYNISTKLDKEVIKEQLEAIAQKNPKAFFDRIDSEDTKVRSVIRIAREANVISYIGHERRWLFTEQDETIFTLELKEGVNEIDQLAKLLIDNPKGPAMRKAIEKLISAKKKP